MVAKAQARAKRPPLKPEPVPHIVPDVSTVRQVMGVTLLSEGAVRNVLSGGPSRLQSQLAVVRALLQLGLPVPVALESVPAGPRPVMVAAPVPVALPPQQQAQAALQTFAAVVRAEATEQPAPPPVVPATVESLTVTGILRKVELMFEQPPAVVLACAESFCAANPGLGAKDFLVWFKGEHDGGRLTGTGKWSASDSFQEKSS